MSLHSFPALLLERANADGAAPDAHIRELHVDELPEHDTLVRIRYSGINYKDALAVTGRGPIVRSYPMVPGIDFSGVVVETSHPSLHAGDDVILTGWGVGERYWGGYSGYQRVKGDWLVPIPASLGHRDAMVLGTAGLTSMLCVMAIQDAGVRSGRVLVTGASGGVGSIAIALLADRGYEVVCLSRDADANRADLQALGASEVIGGPEWGQAPPPLASQRWDAVVDVVGGAVLARALAHTQYGGAAAVCGLAGSAELHTSVMPFILRGVRMLGVDSVMCPKERRVVAWSELAATFPFAKYQSLVRTIGLEQVPERCRLLADGASRGRVVVQIAGEGEAS